MRLLDERAGKRRLLVVAALSVAVHALALPLACRLLVATGPWGPSGEDLFASVEDEPSVERASLPRIREPLPPPPSDAFPPPLPPPPDPVLPLEQTVVPAAPDAAVPLRPVSERLPDAASERHSTSGARSDGGSADRGGGAEGGNTERGDGSDSGEGAGRGDGEGRGDGQGDGTGAGLPAATDAQPGTTGPEWPDEPPPSLFASLRSGGLTTRTLEAQLDPDSRERLVQRVYSLSRYPREALDAESEGTVTVRFRVDRDGNACDIVALPAEQDLHPSLAEEAVRMVEQGAPYPLPTVRSEVDLFVAVAWRNSLGDRGDRIVVVVPSGDRAVDEKARSLAAADARRETALGWHLSAWSVKAVADAPMGGPGAVRLVSFGGDERLRPALEEVVAARLVNASKTGYLRIPIHFRIQPN